MRPYRRSVPIAVATGWLAATSLMSAQLAAPNMAGITTGHIHLIVPDTTEHTRIWTLLGGEEKRSGDRPLLAFPGAYVVLTKGAPVAPSSETAINHVGFSVRDYDDYKGRLEAIGATFVFDSAENGQMIVDLPGGVRLEFLADRQQSAPITFHHAHLSALDGGALRDWYVRVFGAEPGERRNLPSAVLPGGRVDFLPVRGDAPRQSKGAAIDHVGFDVQDLDAFTRRVQALGLAVERGSTDLAGTDLGIAILSDPAGALLEVTEGLDDVR